MLPLCAGASAPFVRARGALRTRRQGGLRQNSSYLPCANIPASSSCDPAPLLGARPRMSARRAAEAAKRLVSHRVVQASGSVQQAKPIAFLPCALTNGSMFLGLAADLSARGFQSWCVRSHRVAGGEVVVLRWHRGAQGGSRGLASLRIAALCKTASLQASTNSSLASTAA